MKTSKTYAIVVMLVAGFLATTTLANDQAAEPSSKDLEDRIEKLEKAVEILMLKEKIRKLEGDKAPPVPNPQQQSAKPQPVVKEKQPLHNFNPAGSSTSSNALPKHKSLMIYGGGTFLRPLDLDNDETLKGLGVSIHYLISDTLPSNSSAKNQPMGGYSLLVDYSTSNYKVSSSAIGTEFWLDLITLGVSKRFFVNQSIFISAQAGYGIAKAETFLNDGITKTSASDTTNHFSFGVSADIKIWNNFFLSAKAAYLKFTEDQGSQFAQFSILGGYQVNLN